VLVCQPLSQEEALPREDVDSAIQQSRLEAHEKGIVGQALTPFLLSRMAELTQNKTLVANLALLHNNARMAAMIARELSLTDKNLF
jgi:pseudouridine-5'-phosphate glycosidase